jgi:hypothetical protein
MIPTLATLRVAQKGNKEPAWLLEYPHVGRPAGIIDTIQTISADADKIPFY